MRGSSRAGARVRGSRWRPSSAGRSAGRVSSEPPEQPHRLGPELRALDGHREGDDRVDWRVAARLVEAPAAAAMARDGVRGVLGSMGT